MIAKFRVITTTQGIARPKAHGHDTTRIEIAYKFNNIIIFYFIKLHLSVQFI